MKITFRLSRTQARFAKLAAWIVLSFAAIGAWKLAEVWSIVSAPMPVIRPAAFAQDTPPPHFAPPYWIAFPEGSAKAGPLQAASAHLMRKAKEALTAGPYSVVWKKGAAASGDPHDYASICPYFWPNPILPGGLPYYWKDGKVNPEAKSSRYDRTSLLELTDTAELLALAYRLTHEEYFAERAAYLLRVWFLDPETRMNPHLQYAQAIPGVTDGYTLGVIRGVELVRLLDSAALLQDSPAWTASDRAGLRGWFAAYLQWVATGAYGRTEAARTNNHGTWHDAQVAAIACFTGREDLARSILETLPSRRLETQIAADGSQPEEVRRSDALYYSACNLRGLFACARLGDRLGFDLWNASNSRGAGLEKATLWIVRELETGGSSLDLDKKTRSDLLALLGQASARFPDPRIPAMHGRLAALQPKDRNLLVWQPSLTELSRR